MTRRGLFGSLIALAVVRPTRKTYGLMTCERWKLEGLIDRNARVMFNGVDVTSLISECHDEDGWILVKFGQHRGPSTNWKWVDNDYRLRGSVEIVG